MDYYIISVIKNLLTEMLEVDIITVPVFPGDLTDPPTVIVEGIHYLADSEDEAEPNVDEELENLVDISSASDSEASIEHMDECSNALRARHKGKASIAQKGKGKATDPALTAHLPSAQQFHAGFHGAVKALGKDSELLKSAKATHFKEAKKLTEELKSTLEDALTEFKELEEFHEEAMAHTDMHAQIVVDKWLEGEVGKQFLLDLGEADYDLGYQDA
nr:uncharacterized protein LOC109180246 [Ipomoea batatas]